MRSQYIVLNKILEFLLWALLRNDTDILSALSLAHFLLALVFGEP